MALQIPVGQGAVILEIGKHIHNRSIVSSAVLQNSQGSRVFVWELDDGETLVLNQNPRRKTVIPQFESEPAKVQSSWCGWQSSQDPIDEVVKTKSSEGFRLSHFKSPATPKHTQLQFSAMPGGR